MLTFTASSPRFTLGQIVITANANSTLSSQEVSQGLCRHAKGDWGNVPLEDASLNEQALEFGDRLLSSYGDGDQRFWIITESDRSVTTVLLPEDY